VAICRFEKAVHPGFLVAPRVLRYSDVLGVANFIFIAIHKLVGNCETLGENAQILIPRINGRERHKRLKAGVEERLPKLLRRCHPPVGR
jgi:hypothetical protein